MSEPRSLNDAVYGGESAFKRECHCAGIRPYEPSPPKGWECPVCHVGVAPFMPYCPRCTGKEVRTPLTPMPVGTPNIVCKDAVTRCENEACEILPSIVSPKE